MMGPNGGDELFLDVVRGVAMRKILSIIQNGLDMTHIQYQGETLPPGISVSPGIR